MSANLLSVLGFIVAAASLAALAILRHLLASHPILIGVQIGAFLLMVWARSTFGSRSFHASARPTSGGLVTTGPYRFLRHPIYASLLYFVWAGQVEDLAALPLALATAATIGLGARMVIEERFLRQEYPDYSSYARRAKRLVPFVY